MAGPPFVSQEHLTTVKRRATNSIGEQQYEFCYHQVAESRGILTNLVHNLVADYLEKHYGLLPLLFYPDGVAYLVVKGNAPCITASDLTAIGRHVAVAGASISRGNFAKFIRPGNQGIKVDRQCLALGTPFTRILDHIYTLCMRKVTGKRFKIDEVERKARERLQAALRDQTQASIHPRIIERLEKPLCPLYQTIMNLSHYQSLDPDMDRGDCQERVKADGNALPAHDQATILLLEPRKGPLGLEPRDDLLDRPASVFLGLPDPLRELRPDSPFPELLPERLGIIAFIGRNDLGIYPTNMNFMLYCSMNLSH
jgi:hypothetical protein